MSFCPKGTGSNALHDLELRMNDNQVVVILAINNQASIWFEQNYFAEDFCGAV